VAFQLTPEILIEAYAAGIFPMAESADDPELFWVDPTRRGIIPLDTFHVPRRLKRVLRGGSLRVRCDTQFEAVMRGCAEASDTRPTTWINDEIVQLYSALFARGAAHSVECWHEGELVGGLYGVSLGAAFFGESMFSRMTGARYHRMLAEALRYRAVFPRDLSGDLPEGDTGGPGGGGGGPGAPLHSSRLTS
jgi:leucyl/phenylalanyl-tRNA--protein transferase